jgi:hypothetical protein
VFIRVCLVALPSAIALVSCMATLQIRPSFSYPPWRPFSPDREGQNVRTNQCRLRAAALLLGTRFLLFGPSNYPNKSGSHRCTCNSQTTFCDIHFSLPVLHLIQRRGREELSLPTSCSKNLLSSFTHLLAPSPLFQFVTWQPTPSTLLLLRHWPISVAREFSCAKPFNH